MSLVEEALHGVDHMVDVLAPAECLGVAHEVPEIHYEVDCSPEARHIDSVRACRGPQAQPLQDAVVSACLVDQEGEQSVAIEALEMGADSVERHRLRPELQGASSPLEECESHRDAVLAESAVTSDRAGTRMLEVSLARPHLDAIAVRSLHGRHQRTALDDEPVDATAAEILLASLIRARPCQAPQERAIEDLRELETHRRGAATLGSATTSRRCRMSAHDRGKNDRPRVVVGSIQPNELPPTVARAGIEPATPRFSVVDRGATAGHGRRFP